MAQFKMLKGDTAHLLESLGNTSQMKNVMGALADIDSENGSIAKEDGWEAVKEAFENFGFTVCYDRNLALLTVALFAAIARSKCTQLITNAKFIINIQAVNKKNENVSLGQAFLNGDGRSIYAILNHPYFKKNILEDGIGISRECVTKYMNRLKKITPWRKLSGSKKVLDVIAKAFTDMTGENFVEVGAKTNFAFDTFVINNEDDFEKPGKRYALNAVISENITKIPDKAFLYCSGLEKVTIPNGVTEISKWTFGECKSLKEVTIPNSVTKIGDGAFTNCESLEKVTIPNGVTDIGDGAFECTSLKEITIPNGVTQIGKYAFNDCKSLKEITIPNSVMVIYFSTFSGCTSLKEVTIPNSVKEIEQSAFEGCKSLEKITIPNSVTKIGKEAFGECPKDMKILGDPRPEILKTIKEQIGQE